MRYEKRIDTLENLIEAAIGLDDKLYERAIKRRHTGQQLGRAKGYVGNRVFETSRKQRHDETMLMKLNAVLSKKSKSNEKRSFDKKKKNTACYACGKKGHYARNCRSKNVIRRQLNMILRKESKTETKENWEQIDYENIDIPTTCSEDEEFFKIDGSQDFQNVLNETRNTDISTTKNVNWTIDQYEHKTVIETTERKPKTPYSGSTRKARINDRSKRSLKADRSVISNLNAEDTINHITDQLELIWSSDASQERSTMKMDQALRRILKKLKKTNTQNVTEGADEIYELTQRCREVIHIMRKQNSHNPTWAWIFHKKNERLQRIIDNVESRKSLSKPELTKKKKHANLNWTACYENECREHFSKKKKSSWYSKKPRRQEKISTQW